MSDASFDTTIGAILAIAASTFNAVGYTVQKKGHNRLKEYNKNKSDAERKRIVQEKTWGIGFGIYLVGGLLNAVSLFYAPQSLVLPLSAITLVVNTVLATKVLGEPFFKADIFGMLSVIIGGVLAVMFGPRTAGGEQNMTQLGKRWGDDGFFLFFVILSACIVIDYLIVRFFEGKNADDPTVTDELKHGSTTLLVSYCLLAGYFGSLAFLFLKSFTEFIGSSASSRMTAKENAVNWYSYFTLFCVVITNFLLEFWRQRGLSYFHAVYVVPINQVVLIVMGTVLGGIYFQEFDSMNVSDGILFCIAILMTVIGVFILAFNSGNVQENTEVKINHTISLSFDGSKPLPNLRMEPSILQTSPSLPITRNVTDEIPDLPPPGMSGVIARIHGLHSRMATMHFNKDGKPFYLDKNANKLSVLSLAPWYTHHRDSNQDALNQQRRVDRATSTTETTIDRDEEFKRMQLSRHVKHSQSLPTYSNSSLENIAPNMGGVEIAMMELDRIEEEKKVRKKTQNGKTKVMNGYEHEECPQEESNTGNNHPGSGSLSSIEIITKKYTDTFEEYKQREHTASVIEHDLDIDT